MIEKEFLKEFKDQVQLKKVLFGGYDKKDVQLKFDIFYEMVERYIIEQQKEFDSVKAELNDKISALTEENAALVVNQEKMKKAYDAYCENVIQQCSSSLCSLSNEFTRILDNVTNLQKEIISKDINEGLNQALEMKNVSEKLEGERNEE